MQSGQDFEGVLMPMPPQAAGQQSSEDLARLGAALKTRTGEVLSLTIDRTSVPGHAVEALVQDSFERICSSSTDAVAGLIAGDDLEVARTAGQETWQIFGELAAHRAASLNEVTRRCLCWRDVMAEVLCQSASELDIPADVLTQALNMLQLALEFSLVRMCECFEAERKRTDEELTRREQTRQGGDPPRQAFAQDRMVDRVRHINSCPRCPPPRHRVGEPRGAARAVGAAIAPRGPARVVTTPAGVIFRIVSLPVSAT